MAEEGFPIENLVKLIIQVAVVVAAVAIFVYIFYGRLA